MKFDMKVTEEMARRLEHLAARHTRGDMGALISRSIELYEVAANADERGDTVVIFDGGGWEDGRSPFTRVTGIRG